MKTLFQIVFFVSIFFSQEEIVLLRTNENNKVTKLEEDIINNVLEIYNNKNTEKIIFKYERVEDFKSLLGEIDKQTKKGNNYFFALGSISMTDERKQNMDFSYPYLPATEVIMGLKEKWLNKTKKDFKKNTLGYAGASLHEKIAKEYEQKYNLKIKKYATANATLTALLKGEIDLVVQDNVNIWNDASITVVDEYEYTVAKGFAIAYPKGSTLKAKLDPILKYYMKSQRFYAMCESIYGREVAEYCKQKLNSSK